MSLYAEIISTSSDSKNPASNIIGKDCVYSGGM
jgi:hypothetical protein